MNSNALLEEIRITFSRETCSDYYYATQKEWLETNGIGGFASSTIINANVRRYHGLLVASLKPPVHRFVLLSKLEETISINGKSFEFSTNQYPFIIYPEGHKNIERFEYDVHPRFVYDFNGILIEKSILMIYGENSTIIRYRLLNSAPPTTLNIRPLCAFREYHSLSQENTNIDPGIRQEENGFSIHPYPNLPNLHFIFNKVHVDPKFFWYKNTEYRKEHERGLEFVEDLFSPAHLSAQLTEGESLYIIATMDEMRMGTLASEIPDLFDSEIRRRIDLIEKMPIRTPLARSLALAADSFLVQKKDSSHTVIAGYHWFSNWGRDTMIALTGLTLTCRKFDTARSILKTFSNYISDGMLPNSFNDSDDTPEYNSADATLWYFIAVYQYWQYTQDIGFIRGELYTKLKDIVDWHLRGTRFGIRMDNDGLLQAGHEGVQLTWMDAKIGEWVVTPRTGKPVEINALWFNALCVMCELAKVLKEPKDAGTYALLAERTKNSFIREFWNDEKKYLYDLIDASGKSEEIRPNQIFAVSLPFEILEREKQKQVVAVVEKELLTPRGLRSLNTSDPHYIGVYAGDPYDRDSAYHQGTIWPWLMGPYLESYMKVNDYSPAALAYCRTIIEEFRMELKDRGIGTISEIFDGDEPHLPKGCISQAWSVAEILRILEILEKRGHA